jgi:hypothetical protein
LRIGCEGVDYIQVAEDRVQWRGFLWIGCEGVDYIQLAEDRVQWRGFLWIGQWTFLTRQAIISFTRTPLYGVS